MEDQSLYERLGGIYAIAGVVSHFSDALLQNPKIVNSSPELKEWHTEKYKQRLDGLKFMRTLWVADVTGGPFKYTGKSLHDAHFDLHVPPEVFDEVSMELGKALDYFNVPQKEKDEVLAAFNAQKPDVTAGAREQTEPSSESSKPSYLS
ncbi:MAG: group 1 truncated hemoglobin [Candidatus Daviesbacteria bacterium]|nr:group 1 truncated hemoglobin [Candidatus Daviesbacteria bacterium]